MVHRLVAHQRIGRGTSDGIGLDVLINALRQLDADVVQLVELVIGGINDDWPVEDHPDAVFGGNGSQG